MADPAQLAAQYQQGDHSVLGELHAEFWRTIEKAVWHEVRVGLPAVLDQDDLRQQSWLLLGALIDRWEPRPDIPFGAYIVKSFPWALAAFVRMHRPARASRREKSPVRVSSAQHDELMTALSWHVADDDGREWADRLYCHELIRALEPRQQAVLWLRVVEERTFEQIGKIVGVSPMTAHRLYRRGIHAAQAS